MHFGVVLIACLAIGFAILVIIRVSEMSTRLDLYENFVATAVTFDDLVDLKLTRTGKLATERTATEPAQATTNK